MGKLYAVTAGTFSDYHIITICTDRDKADRIADWYNRVSRHDQADVEEYEDSVAVPGETDLPYCVKFRTDGSISWTEKCDAEPALWGVVYDSGDGLLRVFVLAPDEESAEEKATKRFREKILEEK